MNKIYNLFFFILIFSTDLVTFAQPILTKGNSQPLPNENFSYHSYSGLVYLTNDGVSQTWDLSGVGSEGQFSILYLNPALTPYNFMFPDADLASFSISDSNYIYYQVTANEFNSMGYKNFFSTTIFNDYQLQLKYPFTYLDTCTDYFESSNGTNISRGNSFFIADGFGTLILPSDTIENTLRIHQTVTVIDSNSASIDTTSYEAYFWYKPGIHFPLCSYFEINVLGIQYQFVNYLDDDYVGIKNIIMSDEVIIFPNPAKDFIQIKFNSNTVKHLKAELYSSDGKLCYRSDLNIENPHVANIDIGHLSPGFYFLALFDDENILYKKILKE
jgi:hypothetical protein